MGCSSKAFAVYTLIQLILETKLYTPQRSVLNGIREHLWWYLYQYPKQIYNVLGIVINLMWCHIEFNVLLSLVLRFATEQTRGTVRYRIKLYFWFGEITSPRSAWRTLHCRSILLINDKMHLYLRLYQYTYTERG